MVTGNLGEVFPVSCVPVLPGDTMQGHTSALIRLSPLNTAVMHPCTVRTHTFFVPNRIVWDGWEDFITGGNDGQGEGQTMPTYPQSANKKGIPSYLGIPPLVGPVVSELSLRAANLIWNEYYRDQDLAAERTLNNTATMNCAWEKDYFTSARPWSQRGPDVSLTMGDTAAVVGQGAPTFDNGSATPYGTLQNLNSSDATVGVANNTTQTGTLNWDDPALIADLSTATSPA